MNKTIVLLLLFCPAAALAGKQTMYVDDGRVYTAAGEAFVMRGFNEMFVWSDDKTGERWIPEIDRSGANSVRLVWDHTHERDADLVALIDNTIARKMAAIPECHNATGKWGEALQHCVDFWHRPALVEAIQRRRQWTILNIANEAGDGNISDKDFLSTYKAAVTSLREWGYTVPIMIDASRWGQDLDQLLRVGPELLAHDPLKNLIFSTHSYWPPENAVDNYLKVAKDAREKGLAMIIGEGPSVTRVGQCDDPEPLPYLEGMKILETHSVGWLNWSWGGLKNGDCDDFRYFDITRDGEFGRWWHEPGANIVALSPYSVMQTSGRPASFYEDGKVKVSGVYLHVEKTALNKGDKTGFQVIVAPANAGNKSYELSISGDKSSIRVDREKGRITALRNGEVTLTATTEDGGLMWSETLTITGSD